MTLGTSLIGTGVPAGLPAHGDRRRLRCPAVLAWLGTGLTYGVPNALLLFVPLAVLLMFALRRTGFGRLLDAVGDNERAMRLSGVLYWQVIVAST